MTNYSVFGINSSEGKLRKTEIFCDFDTNQGIKQKSI